MSLREAVRRCPDGVFLPVDGRRYQQASREVMAILRRFTPQVEPISIDEAFLDVTGSRQLFGDGGPSPVDQGARSATSSVCRPRSASRRPSSSPRSPPTSASPTGWSWSRPVTRRRSSRRCRSAGCGASASRPRGRSRTTGCARSATSPPSPPDVLVRRFGKHGGSLASRARGSTTIRSHDGDPAKSVGHEHTFDVDTSDREIIERTLLAMSDGVAGRLRAAGVEAATIAVKIRDSSFRDAHPPADPARADRPDRPDLSGGGRARPPRGPRHPRPAARGVGLEPRRSRAARPVPDRRPAPPRGDRGGRHDPPAVWQRAVTRGRLVGADLPAPFERDPRNPLDRRARRRRTRRRRGSPTGASAGRDNLADTDVDDSSLDDA